MVELPAALSLSNVSRVLGRIKSILFVFAETNKFSLNADDDFQLFLMMARDTYQLHPSKPLQVVLCKQGEYKMFSAVKKELSAQQAARKNATGKPNGVATNANTVEHRDKVKVGSCK